MTTLLNHFLEVRATTENLVLPLSPEDCQAQSMPDASPAKWHLAHVTWFFETVVLKSFEKNFSPWNNEFQVLFNSYYNSVGDKFPRPLRGLLTRPSLEEILLWRSNINKRISTLLESNPSSKCLWMIELGIHHEQQHQELLLTDIQHLLSCNSLYPAYTNSPQGVAVDYDHPSEKLLWIHGPSGIQKIGLDRTTKDFHFDNESPSHEVLLQPFAIASRLITNHEWQEFISAGGYQDYRWWFDAAWKWLEQENIDGPLYWNHVDNQQFCFTLHGNQPLDPSAPVSHISFYEADAFTRWKSATDPYFKGARLPSEAEWEVFVNHSIASTPEDANLLERYLYKPSPSTNKPHAQQFFGDAWEWTSSSYSAYPGYQAWEGIAGEYNGKFMVNQMVLKGGSCFTPRNHIRSSYRNFFPVTARWQVTGLRLAKNIS